MTKEKHTLVVLSESLPLGGTATFVLNLCDGMASGDGWKCVAAGLRGRDVIGEQIARAGFEILAPATTDILHEDRIEALYRACSRLRPKAVVAGLGSGAFDFLRYVPAGCLRVGMIQSDDEGVYQLVERYLPWLDLVVGVSEEIRRKMAARMQGHGASVYAQPYGVPMVERAKPFPPDGPLRVLYLGRVIEEQKRVDRMARVIERTLESEADIRWTIVGDGPDLDDLRSRFSGANDEVCFMGAVPYRDVPAAILGHEIYFLCSDYEGLPLSLLESMGRGLVPVVSDLPSGISEVVNAENGIRLSPDDEGGFADALIALASDRARLIRLSAAAAAGVRETHSTHAMARRWQTMLEAHLPDCDPAWASACKATAPLEVCGRWRYYKALRPLRKFVKRIKGA